MAGILVTGSAALSGPDLPSGSDLGVAILGPPCDPPALNWTERCEGCHAVAAVFSHPVGVVPSMPVPADLPLIAGRIACITCHDNSSAALHRQARIEGTALLRKRLSEGGLCSDCHDAASPRRSDRHGLMLLRAHLRWPDHTVQRGLASPSDAPRGLFDAQSENCLGCHDGSVASDIGHDGPGFIVRRDGRSLDFPAGHPIGVDYPRHGSDRDGPPLKPPDMLDYRIRLYDDRVGCMTCHSLYSSQRGLLVLPNTGSALCLNCHDY